VRDVWVGILWACSLIFVWLRGKIHVGEWCYEVVESCEVRRSASSQPDKNLCVCLCVCDLVIVFLNKYVTIFSVSQINKVKNGIKLPGVLAEYDKGNYTCIVQNHHTNMSRTFIVDIISMIFVIIVWLC